MVLASAAFGRGMMRKRSLVLGGWLMSMLPLPVAAAAEDPSPAELLSRVMPPLTPAVGFEDRRSLTDFIRRSTKEKDVAVRALGLSNLGRADINGDHCLTRREYDLYLAMWKRWKSSPRAEMVRTIEDYRYSEAKTTGEVMSYTTQLLRQTSSIGEMRLLKEHILLSDENKNKSIELDEVKRFEAIWKFGNFYQWSHGSPGIGHLFIALDEIDPNARWKRGLAGSIASTSRDGPTFRGIDGNCIRSGQGELLVEAYRATRKEAYFQEALRFGAMLVAEEKTGLRDSSGSPCGAGYIFGLAGAGYYFLRLSSPLTVDLPFHVYVRGR